MPLTPNVVDGQIILASWGNQIRDRTLQVFTNFTELATWAAPNGSTAITVDTQTVWLREGGGWTMLARGGPIGCTVSTTGQSVGVGAQPALAWTTETYDTDAFHAANSTDIVFPNGFDGVYGVTFHASAASAVTPQCAVTLNYAGSTAVSYINAGASQTALTIVQPFVAGNVLQAKVYNATAAALFFSGILQVWRISPW